MPEFKARKYSKCPLCNAAIRPGQPCRKLFDESRKTAHAWCVGSRLSEEHQNDPEYQTRVEEFRTKVKAVKCPTCGAQPTQPCRSLGSERPAVHKARIGAWRQSSHVVDSPSS